MKRLFLILLLAWTTFNTAAQDSTTTPAPLQPLPTTQSNGSLTLDRFFGALTQGHVGVLRLSGAEISEARVLFRSHEFPFIADTDGWYALVVADIDAQPRDYPFSVLALLADGSTVSFEGAITVNNGGFVRQTFEVPATIAYLIDPEVERDEFARIDSVVATVSPQRHWSDGWQLPIAAEYTSGFGQYRILNNFVQTRHTGWDQRAPVGTPVYAMAGGVVAFSGQLAIRGNYILIDHGWGVYTGYAHFSQLDVQTGQTITKGQLIGLSGNEGRSSGAHLHWEIAVNGEWVDGDAFINMWLPR